MQQILDHLLSKKLKSACALYTQNAEGEIFLASKNKALNNCVKEMANKAIREHGDFNGNWSVSRCQNTDEKFTLAYGSFGYPRKCQLVIVWEQQSENVGDEKASNLDDFRWVKINWFRLVSSFESSIRIERIESDKLVNSSNENRNEEIVPFLRTVEETVTEITCLFENMLLKRNRKLKSDECWDNAGIDLFRQEVHDRVTGREPILFVLPAFPFKSGNTLTKVLGTLPDMAEKLGLERLEGFLSALRNIYSPGARLLIFTDGRVYCDLFRIPDRTATDFNKALRKMVDPQKSDIEWTDLDDTFPNPDYTDNDKRQALLQIFGANLDVVVKRIKTDVDFCEVYKGFKKFMREELHFPAQWGDRAVRLECGRVAKLMVQRTDAYQALIRCLYPQCIRLSIHPSTSTWKFSIDLVGKTDWGTPWHNCALLQPDGSWSLIRRGTALKLDFKLNLCGNGLHYFVNDSGKLFTEKL